MMLGVVLFALAIQESPAPIEKPPNPYWKYLTTVQVNIAEGPFVRSKPIQLTNFIPHGYTLGKGERFVWVGPPDICIIYENTPCYIISHSDHSGTSEPRVYLRPIYFRSPDPGEFEVKIYLERIPLEVLRAKDPLDVDLLLQSDQESRPTANTETQRPKAASQDNPESNEPNTSSPPKSTPFTHTKIDNEEILYFEISDKSWTTVNIPKHERPVDFHIVYDETIFLKTGNLIYKLVPDPKDPQHKARKVYCAELNYSWDSPYKRQPGPFNEIIPPHIALQSSDFFELKSQKGPTTVTVTFVLPYQPRQPTEAHVPLTAWLVLLFIIAIPIIYYIYVHRAKSRRIDFTFNLPLKHGDLVQFRVSLIYYPKTDKQETLNTFRDHIQPHIESSLVFFASYRLDVKHIAPQDLAMNLEETIKRFKRENPEYAGFRIKPYITSVQVLPDPSKTRVYVP